VITTTAASVLDLQMSTPDWVDDKAAICTAQLVHFDIVSGLLQLNTACAASRNTWLQTVMYNDWSSVVIIGGAPEPPPLPLEDEENAEDAEPLVQELPVVEDTALIGTESWPEVLAKFPALINMDVKVHCTCPAFRWWGSWYTLEQRDTALLPEGLSAPTTRDPELSNIICKHLAAVFAQHF
jgi:hypothetical protein